MLANVPRRLRTASFYLVFAGVITACQSAPRGIDSLTPPPLNTEIPTTKLSQAQQQLDSLQFTAAETDFQTILKSSSDQITLQQALAGLTLVYLHPQSPFLSVALATATIDRLHQQMTRWPQNAPSLNLLIFSLKLSLAQRLTINEEVRLRENAQTQQQQLLNETFMLRRALEKLRQLTLQ